VIGHTKTSIRNLIHLFQWNANPEMAVQMSRYMKNEFFIRKAIGWTLRQYSYTNMEAVVEFVRKNE